ncbi:MAG: VOC family protein [Betaproteobacteria bacterium]|nr:VOC family protein [Betaproteobacteria bacterium]
MPVTGLDHYNLRASRDMLETLKDFYCDVVGLTLGTRPPFASFGYWLYAGDAPILHLSETRVGEVRPAHTANTFDHAAFRCEEFDATLARLDAANIRYKVQTVPGTRVRQIFFADPAGNGVELNFDGD